jgi:hypothetical protein
MGGDGLDALIVRDARPDHLGFVQRMLYEAVNRPGDDWPTFKDCMEEPRNRRHWIGFMTRAGDLGIVAELARRPVGAAWVRRMHGNELRSLDDPGVPVLVERQPPMNSKGVCSRTGHGKPRPCTTRDAFPAVCK